jgi:hypothetical protein
MMFKAIAVSVATVSIASSSALAADLTERIMSERMTVVKVDRAHGRFLCAEHRHWTWISKQDAALISTGDIASLQHDAGSAPRLRVVRTAADELTSPEW